MVSSINASSLNLSQNQSTHYNTNVTATQNEEETKKASSAMVSQKLSAAEAASTDDGTVTETSTQGDTLTLSQEGMEKSKGGTPPAGAAPAASTSSDSSSSSSSEDLSSYSESQLQTKLNNGEISQAAYNKELARRATEDAGVTDTTTKALSVKQSMVSQIDSMI